MGWFSDETEADKLESQMARKGGRQRASNYKAPFWGGDRCTSCGIEKRYHHYVPRPPSLRRKVSGHYELPVRRCRCDCGAF